MRCQREHGIQCLVASGAKNGVLAEVSGECGSILHDVILRFLLPMSTGHPQSERSRSQGPALHFWEDRQGESRAERLVSEDGGGTETPRAAQAEAEAHSSDGRG